jgi:hypothetical protein
MKGYLVTWEIELDADSPEAAARLALEIQRDPNSIATVFQVQGENGEEIVDITELDAEAI